MVLTSTEYDLFLSSGFQYRNICFITDAVADNGLIYYLLVAVVTHCIQYNTIQYDMIQYGMIQYSMTQYSMIQYSTIHYGTI